MKPALLTIATLTTLTLLAAQQAQAAVFCNTPITITHNHQPAVDVRFTASIYLNGQQFAETSKPHTVWVLMCNHPYRLEVVGKGLKTIRQKFHGRTLPIVVNVTGSES